MNVKNIVNNSIMDVTYLKSEELIKKTINGTICITNGIDISKNVNVSYGENLNNICFNERIHLIDLLVKIKNQLEKKIDKLLNEKYVKDYISHVLSDEWLLSIQPVNLIDKENIEFKYLDYHKYSSEYKKTENKELKKKFEKIKSYLIKICRKVEPTYMYVITDLCTKQKIDYLKYNNISDNKLKLKSDMNIRFINYIQILNLIKKELNIIINECNSIINLINK